MADNRGTLESIGAGLGRLFSPLEERLSEGQVLLLMAELGMEFPPELETKTGFTNALKKTISTAKSLPGAIAGLAEAVQAENIGDIISKGVELVQSAITLGKNIDETSTELKNVGALPGVDPGELQAFAQALPTKLTDFLVVRNLEGITGLAETMEFLEAIEREDKTSGPLHYTERKLTLDKFTQFITKPGDRLNAKYKWGAGDFNGLDLLKKAEKYLVANGFPAILDTSGPLPVLDAVFAEIKAKTDIDPKGIEIKIMEPITVENSVPFTRDDFTVEFLFNGKFDPNTTIVIQPNANVSFHSAAKLEGNAAVRFTAGQANGEPYLILGQAGGSRLEARQFYVEGGAGMVWDIGNSEAKGVFKILGGVKGGRLVVDFSQADGFLGQILSGIGLESNFDLGLGFSSKEGIFFLGAATLEIQLPTHIDLGVVQIDALTFLVGIENNKFPIGLSANIGLNLGPLKGVVEGIGVKAFLSMPPDRKGNAGPVQFDFGFKPPNGIGLSIDAGVIFGGGYLFFDFDREEYAGVLQLDIAGFVTINAIGLITTRMPDGSKGFSMLVILTVEFSPGIQLGFGFTFLGIGGLLGLNRTVLLEVLAQGIRNGTLNSIMFPQGDIIANAPRIISDLRAIFPPEESIFLVGPMVKIGWGTPTLISVALGVILEIPGNFAIVGVLKVALPTADAPLIIIQVAFIGAVEFDKERLWFFASMFDSRVLFITLEGEMGLLIGWGQDANFVVSVGGFHPQFSPPPLPFPSPRRIALDLSNTPGYRVRIEGYFAVTSNTVQFGAKAELVFGFSDFGIQGHIGFDALFQFSPFYFIIGISASVSLRVFGFDVFSIRLKFTLEGPAPYRAKGSGSISILFFEFSADFDVTWGESRDTTLPPIAVMPLLKGEFDKVENWKAELPTGSNLLVSLRELNGASDLLVLHPVGVLRISQRLVPLDLTIDKLGSQKPSDAKKFSISVNTVNLGEKGKVDEQFAMAQFQEMKDADKLSRPAFQPNKGGVDISVTGQQMKTSRVTKRIVRYETIIIDSNFKRFVIRFFTLVGSLFYHFTRGNSVTQSVLSMSYKKQRKPYDEAVAVIPENYVVAYTTNNSAYAESAVFSSEAQAMEFMNEQLAASPELSEQLHVIPEFETFSAS